MTPRMVMASSSSDCLSASTSTTRDVTAVVNGDDDTENNQNNNSNSNDYHYYYFLNSQAAQKALPEFRYNGQDLSLTYKYVLSPFAEFCVQNWTPKTVAPNTITLTGLCFMVVAYSAMWYYNPKLLSSTTAEQEVTDEIVPRWVFLLNAMAILIYQTLDNMDGKQARRVGASSPLGLLFDHGCDAVNSVFGSANWITAMALTGNDMPLCFAMLMGPYALFYISTWEEYFTGKLVMPLFNGPNEGLLGAVAMSLVTYVHGPQYWHSYSWWNALLSPTTTLMSTSSMVGPLRNADLLVLASSIGFFQEIALKVVGVISKYGVSPVMNLMPFLTLVLCSLVVGMTDMNIWLEAPRTSLHLCAILFVEMTTELMLTHMTKQEYRPLQRFLLWPLVLLTMLVATHTWPSDLMSTHDFLLAYTAAAGSFLVLKTTILIHEICHILNIWCFDIVTPREEERGGGREHHRSKAN